MPPAPKRPLEEASKAGSEKKKLVQTKLSFGSRATPWSTLSSLSSSSTSSSSRNAPSSSSSTPSSSRYTYSAPYTTPTSSRHFSSSSAPSSQRRTPAGRGGLFKNRQWTREDSGGSSSLSGLSLSDDGGRDETLRKPKPFDARYNAERAAVAKETIELIPEVLTQVPEGKKWASLYCDPDARLDASKCPGYTLPANDADAGKKGCRIKVVNGDSFDTAIGMGKIVSEPKAVAVLNMANARHPGGGWRKGAMAQEEELCYRSTLWRTLYRNFYPIPEIAGIYSPSVIIFRSTSATGHVLYPTGKPFNNLSVISIAALRDPPLTDTTPPDFKSAKDREITLEKIRMTLRIAALEGHTRLVLGALGCGAFNGPKERVAECFLQVFVEPEFSGGWWREVVFAVMDMEKEESMKGVNGGGNFGVFWRTLNGMRV